MPRPRTLVLAAVALVVLIQFVPYGHAHDNPAPTKSPRWDSARTAKLFADGCGSCHSYNTTWPWYSKVAPSSWLVQHDVDDGRGAMNVSHWDRPQPGIGEVAEQIQSGEMPPAQYKLLHGEARLSSSEKNDLIRGLQQTWASDPPAGTKGG